MKNRILIRIWISINVIISIILTSFGLYFYTTEPSLHYIAIFYFSIGIFLMGIVQFLILASKQSILKTKLNYTFFLGALLISIPILIDDNVSYMSRIIGIVFCSLFILSMIYLLLKVVYGKEIFTEKK